MLYRNIGKTGEKASILGLGCMRLPVLDDKPHLIDENKASEMVYYAIDHGINYVDTAYPYHAEAFMQPGMSEIFLGKTLKNYGRDKVNLATKLPSWAIKTRGDMDRYLDEQLARLQTDHIDFYLIHSLNADFWANLKQLDVFSFLEAAVADGRIKHAGFSFHDELPVFKEIVDAYDWEFCQIQYNFMDENYQAGREGLHYAAARGMGIVIMEPLRGGSLATRVPPEAQRLWDSGPVKRSPVAWALRYLWNQPEISVVLSGMSTMEQLEENIRIAGKGAANSLTSEEQEIIDKVRKIYRDKVRVNCTGCRYCMPCPVGVNIPANFLHFNNTAIYGESADNRQFYNLLLKKEEKASNCVDCGRCEQACPQNIPIRKTLKEVVELFGN